jgi:endonuclease/exonuclease/phosphatase family metal-dependent hydrolase
MTTRPIHSTFIAMTFNVGNGLATGPRLCRYLRSIEVDVVGLQEVSAHQARAIEARLASEFPHRIIRATGFSGRAVLSRFPILEHDWLHIDPERPDLRVCVNVNGSPLTCVIAHPSPPRPKRNGFVFDDVSQQQIRDIARVAVEATPAIILGDFNMTVRNPSYHWMTGQHLTDAYLAAGPRAGKTFPLRVGRSRRVNRDLSWVPLRPIARVDYIWHTAGISSQAAWLGEDVGSDHLPVLARLEIRH